MTQRTELNSGKARIAPWALAVGILGVAAIALGSGWNEYRFQSSRKSTDPPLPARGKLGQDLFMAIGHGDAAGVKSLLKQGADPNSLNGLEFRPLYLAAATHQIDVMQSLISAGAKPDAASTYGTALSFACVSGNAPGAKMLLDLGAKINALRSDGMTPLMLASNTGAPDVVAELLKRKADINATDDSGASALSMAAREGNVAALKLLVAAGANVNNVDVQGITPLMEASMSGHSDCVVGLLKSGANVNAKDRKGHTAVVLASLYGDYPEVITALRNRGAKADSSCGTIAAERGYSLSAAILGVKSHPMSYAYRSPRSAINLSLRMLQSSMNQFCESTACVSCHHEGLGRIATGEAVARGFKVDSAVQTAQTQRLGGMLGAMRPLHEAALKSSEVMKQVPLIEINEVSTIDSWVLTGMAAHGEHPTAGTDAMAMVLARQQSKEGSWTFSLPRTPMQSSNFTFTALTVRALSAYGPKSHGVEIYDRISRAKQWLRQTPAQNSEDRASRLLGLQWTGAGSEDCKDALASIVADQRKDGGWSQLPNMASDAYATGQALYALHVGGGMPVSDPVYKQGVQYLLRTQDPDGTWFVTKRAMPANNYFDAGFPHGESQFASFNGTSWATLALLQTIR